MRRAKQVLLVSLAMLLTVDGASASIFGRRKAATDPAATTAAALSLTAIESAGSVVTLRTSGTPAYTSYSPLPNVFVIDLTSTTKGAGLAAPSSLPAGVQSVSTEETMEMGTRLTRVTFHLAQPLSIRASAVENSVVVAFPNAASSTASADPAPVPADAAPAAVVASVPVIANAPAAPAEPHTDAPRIEPVTEVASAPITAEPLPPVEAASLPKARNLRRIEAAGSGDDIEVRLTGDGALTYKSFRLENPARLVIDLPGVSNHAAPSVPLSGNAVKRVRAGQFKGAPDPVARVVFELAGKPEYKISQDGDHLFVRFGNGMPATASVAHAPAANRASVPAARKEAPASSDIATSSPVIEPKVAKKTATPVMKNGEPVARAEKRASSAAPSAKNIEPAPQPKKVPETASADLPSRVATIPDDAHWKMTADSGNRSAHSVINATADQAPPTPRPTTTTITPTASTPGLMNAAGAAAAATNAQENVFNEPQTAAQTPGTATAAAGGRILSGQGPGGRTLTPGDRVFTGEPISLNLVGADLRDVLRTFSQLTGLNMAIDPDVHGTVTVNFTEVPWDQALDIILRQNNLQYVLEGNVMRIGTIERLAGEASATAALEEQRRLNVPTVTVIFKLSYAKAADVSSLIRSLGSKRASVIVDTRTNQLIVTEIPQYLPTLRNLIETVDIPTRQVMIEARIVEVTKVFQQTYGFAFGFNGALDPALGTGTGLIFPNRIGFTGGPFNFGVGNPVLQLHLSDVLGTFNLDLALNASEFEGLVKVVSAPRVTTQDNQAADIQSGFQLPYQTTTCTGATCVSTVSYLDATLHLAVTPQITESGTVIMDIQVSKNDPATGLAFAGTSGTPVSTRSAHTRLMMRDGGTAVIGGIYQITDNNGQNRLPFVYQIPVIGNLFKTHNTNVSHDELLMFITARIVRGT